MEITGKKQKLRKNAFILFFLLPTLVCFCVFYLYPIATVVISSFAKWDYTNLNDMQMYSCLLYTSPSPRDGLLSRMPSSA